MATSILLGRSTELTVTFRAFFDDTDTGTPIDPNAVTGQILDVNDIVVSTFTPIRDDLGVYSYVWTPDTIGTFTVQFVGDYGNNEDDIVGEEFVVSATSQSIFLTTRLGDDQFLQFMPEPDDIFIDPEEITGVFPDASPIDTIGLIHTYSVEVQELMGPLDQDPSKWPMVNFDYIRAATLCTLSKLYGFGDADITQITLGDLEITNQRFGRDVINRSNATTWCELAGALREEMVADSGRGNFRAIVKGSAFTNPIPRRHIRQFDHGR